MSQVLISPAALSTVPATDFATIYINRPTVPASSWRLAGGETLR